MTKDVSDRNWSAWKALLFTDVVLSMGLLILLLALASAHGPNAELTELAFIHFPLGLAVPVGLSVYLANRKRLVAAIALMALALPSASHIFMQ